MGMKNNYRGRLFASYELSNLIIEWQCKWRCGANGKAHVLASNAWRD